MDQSDSPLKRRVKNLSWAALAGQAGCVTLLIVMSALIAGLWLDAQFNQRGPFTICMVILSVPVSLYAMLQIAFAAINRIQIVPEKQNTLEE